MYRCNIHFKDARPEKEFVVSRIPGAERVDPDNLIEGLARAEDILSHTPADQTAVLYCSVGYRSCLVADKLMQRWQEEESMYLTKFTLSICSHNINYSLHTYHH